MYDFHSLEFEDFKTYLKNSFSSSFAADAAEALRPLESVEDILRVQRETAEAIELAENGKIVENDDEFHELYAKLKEPHFSLEPLEFIVIRNFLDKVDKIKEKLLVKRIKYLKNIIESIDTLSHFKEEITSCIEDNGEIKDDATPELRAVRRGLAEYKSRIKSSLHGIFNSPNADKFIQDRVIVLRGGRYTVPCKTNFSQYMQGIIHDKSSSGQTLYIEPASCVQANNAMQELIIKESEEIAKIIYSLMSILKYSSDLIDDLTEKYKYLSMRLEIGFFYRGRSYAFGEIGGGIRLEKAHHPLLYLRKGDGSVPIDFELAKDAKTAVITGPNTGGKTAALKSVGLNHLITFCGLPFFGSAGTFVHYSSILADIGDKQSIVMDLSTFSSHMINIKNIVDKAGENTLVLFDELGTGTEPREGASLAVSILKYLERRGASSIVTTHYPEVKNYALNDAKAVFYAVDFDYDTFEPRYRLIKDVLGKSDPILIARRLGFRGEIIDEAEKELLKYKSSVEMGIEELNRLTAEAERTKRILDAKEAELEEKQAAMDASEESLKKRLNSKELELLEEAYALLQRGKRLASEKIKAKPSDIDTELKKAAEKIDKLKSERRTVQDISAGDVIFLERYGKTAKIVSIEGDSINLNMEGMRVKINKKDAVGRKVERNRQPAVKITSHAGGSSARRELLLIGKRAEEALDMLDKFIDESLLSGYEKVYIIHGRGSGQLRKAVHEALRNAPRVRRYSLAGNEEGGNAVTIAEF